MYIQKLNECVIVQPHMHPSLYFQDKLCFLFPQNFSFFLHFEIHPGNTWPELSNPNQTETELMLLIMKTGQMCIKKLGSSGTSWFFCFQRWFLFVSRMTVIQSCHCLKRGWRTSDCHSHNMEEEWQPDVLQPLFKRTLHMNTTFSLR